LFPSVSWHLLVTGVPPVTVSSTFLLLFLCAAPTSWPVPCGPPFSSAPTAVWLFTTPTASAPATPTASAPAGSSTTAAPASGVIGAVLRRERLVGGLGSTACLRVAHDLGSSITNAIGLSLPTVGSAVGTATDICSVVTVALAVKGGAHVVVDPRVGCIILERTGCYLGSSCLPCFAFRLSGESSSMGVFLPCWRCVPCQLFHPSKHCHVPAEVSGGCVGCFPLSVISTHFGGHWGVLGSSYLLGPAFTCAFTALAVEYSC